MIDRTLVWDCIAGVTGLHLLLRMGARRFFEFLEMEWKIQMYKW
jgi:hypothetical protein